MKENIYQNWLKPLIGLIVLLAVSTPVIAWELSQNEQNGIVVAGMLGAGIFLGYVLSRSNMGFAGPIKKIVQNGDGRQAKALILLFMICSIFAGGAIIAFGTDAFAYPLNTAIGVGTIVGAVLFGIGMTLASGCASGTLTDVGEGVVPAFLTLIFFMLGSVAGVTFYGSSLDINFTNPGENGSIANGVNSVSLGVLINILILAAILSVVVAIHKWRAYCKTQVLIDFDHESYQKFGDLDISPTYETKKIFSYQTWERFFAKRWSWFAGVIGIALWFAFTVLVFKQTPGITSAYTHWGIELTNGFGNQQILQWHQGWTMTNDAQSWQNIGIIVGALCAKLFANKFKFVNWQNQKFYNWFLYALGGLLMGLGARLARGCNFGALFTGITFQTGFGWVFAICLVPASAITAYVIKKIRHNSPSNLFKLK